jgi:4-amino-4-deoxy-L-arabinose transferase-like glycosyltransferase
MIYSSNQPAMKTMPSRLHTFFNDLENHSGLQLGLLIAITLLAALLRIYKLGEWSFWIDEVLWVNFSTDIFSHFFMRWPLSAILIHSAVTKFGINEWSARLSPAIIGIATIPILFFPLKKLFNPTTSLLALALLAISPWHLYWSQNARFYTALLLFYNIALFVCYIGIEEDRPALILLAIFLLFIAFNERQQILFLIPIFISYILLLLILRLKIPPGVRLRNFFLVAVPIAAYGLYDSSLLSFFFNPFFGPPNHDPFRLLASVIYWVGIPLICLGLVSSLNIILKKDRRGLIILLGAWVPLILLFVISPLTFTVDRYVFISLPCWATLGAIAINDLFSQALPHNRLLLSGILLILLLEPLGRDYLYFEQQNGARLDWKQAFEFVKMRKQEGDLVYTTWPELGEYYLDEDVLWINDFRKDAKVAQQRVWFVIEESNMDGSQKTTEWISENSQLMKIISLSLPGKNLNIRISFHNSNSQ